MCAQFGINTPAKLLNTEYGAQIPEELNHDFNLLVRGFLKTDQAPILINKNGKTELIMAHFSLVPKWAKEFPVPFTTYNARLERENPKTHKQEFIYQVPTFKDSFINGNTCLVPMNYAVESSYFGKSAGNMVKFFDKNNSIFLTVGLYSQYLNKATGELLDTFTLLTDDPYPFFFENGHDRSVLVIPKSKNEDWLFRKFKPEERLKFLRENRINLDWGVEIDRPLKAGWEKRAPKADEINQIRVWEQANYSL